MRKYILLAFTSVFCLISYNVFTNAGGPPSGVAGEPPLNETCAEAGCHVGSALNSGGGTATIVCKDSLNNTVTSYEPNHTYTLTLTMTEGSKTRYGFEAVVKKGSGSGASVIGSLVVSDPTHTQIFQGSIMHKAGVSGIDFSSGTGSWTFKWKAPNANFGTATVYAAFNAANKDLNASGDKIYTKTLDITGTGPTVGISVVESIAKIFPNPASDMLCIDLKAPSSISIINLSGEVVKTQNTHALYTDVSIADLPKGIYLVRITTESETGIYRFVKQ
jgi:hypothetical protein